VLLAVPVIPFLEKRIPSASSGQTVEADLAIFNTDMNLKKTFALNERYRFTLGANFFNVLNHLNWKGCASYRYLPRSTSNPLLLSDHREGSVNIPRPLVSGPLTSPQDVPPS
jgi:hypothetical protein